MRIKGWTKLTSQELWESWKALFKDEAEAEVTAIWIANRLVKDRARSTRRRFYEVKDGFIRAYQDCLTEGRCTRVERRYCRACGGSGDEDLGGCEACDGTGIYSERTLYCHYFFISGHRYSFHSYEVPARLSETPREDKEEFGGRFSDSELEELMLPSSGLLRMLRWVYMARGFNVGKKTLAKVEQSVMEIPVVAGSGFREEYKSDHPANCFCQFARQEAV
jgi:hypothetical protein